MIKIRLNAFSEGSEIERLDNENLKELVVRVLKNSGHENVSEELLNQMTVLINGLDVDPEMWPLVTYKDSDDVLVATVIRGGNFGQIFKQVAIIAITIVASVLLTPAAGASTGAYIAAGLEIAAISIGTTLLLNSLIPPPQLGLGGGFGAENNSLESSQMYSITSQSNKVNKYGHVPKVYGRHKMFPVVAANPYAEIEADPSTGNLVQFFYCIYDFGLGPLTVSDLKIGDTNLTDFADISYNLVDPNKPAISEGPWDDVLRSDFQFYKGDIEQESVVVGIHKNRESGAALDDYQVIRNASDNANGDPLEIILDFVNPQGLIAYATNGETYSVNIDLEIYFSKVGEDNWIPWNDSNFVSNFSYAGGSNVFSTSTPTMLPYTTSNYTSLGIVSIQNFNVDGYSYYSSEEKFGYPRGADTIVLSNDSGDIGDVLVINGIDVGIIESKSHFSGSFYNYKLNKPLEVAFHVFTRSYWSRNVFWLEDPTPSEWVLPAHTISVKKLVLGKARITRKDTSAVYSTFKFSPKTSGAYKVRVTRVRTFSDASYQVLSNLVLATIVTRFDRNPIRTTNRHVFLELKIRATNQINGSVQNLSGVVDSVLDYYDTNTNTWKKKVTNNPAWVFCDLLTGPVNKRAISKSRLHLPSILEWANFSDQVPTPPPGHTYLAKRFETNFVLDFECTLQQALNLVSNAAQASLNIADGKYGVLVDKLKTVPVQVFTPRNTIDFSSTRNYVEPPHALKIKFVDPQSWEVREQIVYDDGYDLSNAVTFDELDTFGCTNPEQAWRFGRYMMAQAKLRQEQITITVDFEYLVCTRGDYVRYVQDVMKVGGRAARVKSIAGSTIKIDDSIDTIGTASYGYMFRSVSGIYQNSLTVIDAETFQLNGTLPAVGDLIVIGEVDHLYIDCIVKSINPQGDLTAQLTLVEKADAIYRVESSGVIPPYNPQLSPTENTEFAPPGEVTNLIVEQNSYRCNGNGYDYFVKLDWDVPTGAAYDIFEIYADTGKGFNLVNFTKETFFEYIVDETYLGFEHKFKILAVSASGKKLDLGEVTSVSATPVLKTTPPSSVEALYLNVTDETIQIDWNPIADCDVFEYIIRYAPNLNGTWEASIPLMRVDRNTTLAQAQARTGTYLIKASDFNGNQSLTAAIAITSIPNLTGLNFIEETNDFPSLDGNLVQTVKDGGTLELQKITSGDPSINEYYSEGYYYFRNLLDLGEIYTVRLQSLVEAEGFTVDDIMSNWNPLSNLTVMSGARESEWSVESQVRATDTFNVISEWTNLSDVDFMSAGISDNWTEFRKFTIGDFTGRVFEFRLKLISYKASVTPRVINGVIRADMPDRIETYNNLTAPSTGYTLVYNPPFKGPGNSPNIQITQDAAQSGDYYIISSKSLNGFSIVFYDKNDLPVERTFDVAVKGYGRRSNSVL